MLCLHQPLPSLPTLYPHLIQTNSSRLGHKLYLQLSEQNIFRKYKNNREKFSFFNWRQKTVWNVKKQDFKIDYKHMLDEEMSWIRLSEVSTFRMSSFTNLIETTVENSSDYLQQFSEQTQPARLAQRLFELLERLVEWSSLQTTKTFRKFNIKISRCCSISRPLLYTLSFCSIYIQQYKERDRVWPLFRTWLPYLISR